MNLLSGTEFANICSLIKYFIISPLSLLDITQNLGRIDLITSSFQNCYLGTKKTESNFLNLINSSENEYSRYLFFHLGNIIEKKDYELVNEISKTIDPLMSSLLIAQSKKWIDENKYEKFNNYFSCKSENDLLAE